MTRGKHAISAEARHAVEERDAKIRTLEHAVARLTAERDELRTLVETERLANANEKRVLRLAAEEAVSPQIDTLQSLLGEARKERDTLTRTLDATVKLRDGMLMRVVAALNHLGVPMATANAAVTWAGDGRTNYGELPAMVEKTQRLQDEAKRAKSRMAVLPLSLPGDERYR